MLNQHDPRIPVSGGGAAAMAGPMGAARMPRTFTLEELGQRSDALALRLGTKVTASAVLLAAVVVILVGAQSLLASMQSMDADLKKMVGYMTVSNEGLDKLNVMMDSVPLTAQHMDSIVGSVEGTSTEVKTSARSLTKMAGVTETLEGRLGSIADSTKSMRTSLEATSADTERMGSTITELNGNIGPLVTTQHEMLLGTTRMRGGLDDMNDSLAYTIRTMNYITAPPYEGGMVMRTELPKAMLPPIPGLKAEVAPVSAFARYVWPVYTGP